MKIDSDKPALTTYRAKRDFDETPEPERAKRIRPSGHHRFVVQRHDASHLHYDFRLEADGVLKSWAVPKGPTLDPNVKRLAMQVEDHPLDYYDFEGTIPKGNYGAGEVIVWDWGTYEVVGKERDAGRAIHKGHIKIAMNGEKLKGEFALFKLAKPTKTEGRGGKKDNAWLLTKSNDSSAMIGWDLGTHDRSVKNVKTKAKKRRDPFPTHVGLELATLVDAPFDDERWLFEVKWDGFRALTSIDDRENLSIRSRNDKDFKSRFPSLLSLKNAFLETPILVDGEIVALTEEGKSSFQGLQNGSGADLTYVVFDILYARGRDLRGESLETRKSILKDLIDPNAKNVVYSDHVVGSGIALFGSASKQGLEGIIAKRRDSKYIEGRSRDWLKIKAQLEQECVIVGYTDPQGGRAGFGSLVLGLYEGKNLVYCGNVGTGFDHRMLESLEKKMKAIATKESPFATIPKMKARAHWVAPKLVAQVRFTEWTRDGSMRHPAFLGLRDDKSPKQCHREIPQKTGQIA